VKGEGTYNVVVIGAGTAGLVTAAGTAGLGGRVALIERGAMGGDCLNTGCVPSKALLSSARLIHQMRHADRWGVEAREPDFAFEEVFERMRRIRREIAVHDSQERFEKFGVDVFRGEARFLSPREVRVGDVVLRARNFVIAAGSRPAIPPIDGLDSVPYYTNETIFDELEKRPGRIVILGGGPIGCELSQLLTRLSVAVTIVQLAPRLLEREDADAASLLRSCLEEEGVQVLVDAQVRRVRAAAQDAIRVDVERAGERPVELECDALIVAAGRAANTQDLDLERAGVAFTEQGVTVDRHLRTSQPHIYAAGDIAGRLHFTHVADSHARTIVRNILFPWLPARCDSLVPWCTYTSPEIARVGLNEEEARGKSIPCDVYREPLSGVDRAVVESAAGGFAKVLTAKGSDRILGVTLACEHAGDLISEFVVAMKNGIGLKSIAKVIHPYPTFSEIARRLADSQQKSRLTPLAKRIFAWLYRVRRGE